MGVWEYGRWIVIFDVQKCILLNANKNLEKRKASMGVWKYGSVENIFYEKYIFINSSLKPFIHACFREYEN